MNIKQVRFFNFIFIALMITMGKWNYLWYIGAMHVSLEILNSRKLYLAHPYKIYNLISWSYGLVLLERLRSSHFSERTEWAINCAEHLFFGIVICLNIYIYATVFTRSNTLGRWRRAILAFILFNLVGLFNEVFQNLLTKRELFVFIPDSVKDIQMNLTGSAIFLIAVLFRIAWLKREKGIHRKHSKDSQAG